MTIGRASESIKRAAHWYAQLTSGTASQKDYQEWEKWKTAHAENATAWRQVEEITGTFNRVPSSIGLATLDSRNGPRSISRRRALKQLGVLLTIGAAGGWTYREQPWAEVFADYSTATGEHREIILADGTRLFLNTASAVDVAFGARQRTVRLIRGEVLIQTGHEQGVQYRPFVLETSHGAVTALGTRFSVRYFDERSAVSVFEHAVEIVPVENEMARVVVHEGESITFTSTAVSALGIADPTAVAWSNGFLVVDQMSLGDFVVELERYRKGVLYCDPVVAPLKISGSFPVSDTDAALAGIAAILPVQIETCTRYWVKIKPA